MDPSQTLGSQVASERERLQPYLEGVKGVTGLELPTLEFNSDKYWGQHMQNPYRWWGGNGIKKHD